MIFISEVEELRKRVEELEQENQTLRKENESLQVRINRAKNAEARRRVSWDIVKRWVEDAGLNLDRVENGWRVSMASVSRVFRSLKEIWLFFTQANWYLSDLFPELDPHKEQSKPKPQGIRPRFPQRFPSLAPAALSVNPIPFFDDE